MVIIDKAAWHIDGGEKEDAVLNRFQIVFSFLHDHGLLNAEGERMLQERIDDSISLNSDMMQPEGTELLKLCYDRAIIRKTTEIYAYLAGAYEMLLHLKTQ
jgi:hypothetical protein